MKKRYLFIEGELNGGGAERVLLDILRHFDYEHYEVDLLQITGGGTIIDEVPKDVHIIEAWHGYPLTYRVALRCSLWMGWQVPLRTRVLQSLAGRHYDVAISFLEGLPLKVHALVTQVADRNYTWVHCDLDRQRYEIGLFRGDEEPRAYNQMDAVVCVAKETAKAFERRFPKCKAAVRVIHNPIDIEKVVSLGEDEAVAAADGIFRIVVAGRLTEPKRLDRVLRLAQRLKSEGLDDVRIQLVGDGELREELMRQSVDLDVTDRVEFVGFVRNPYPYIKVSELLLSTSAYEGFSLVICEAMALGVPVVATRTAGPIEILDNDRFGLLCDHNDESIYQSVVRMYRDADLRRHYGVVGQERVRKYSVERTMAKVYELSES